MNIETSPWIFHRISILQVNFIHRSAPSQYSIVSSFLFHHLIIPVGQFSTYALIISLLPILLLRLPFPPLSISIQFPLLFVRFHSLASFAPTCPGLAPLPESLTLWLTRTVKPYTPSTSPLAPPPPPPPAFYLGGLCLRFPICIFFFYCFSQFFV